MYAALRKESRMLFINATTLNRKSGGEEWRDLLFSRPILEMFFDRSWASTHPRLKNMRTRKLWVPHISHSEMWVGC